MLFFSSSLFPFGPISVIINYNNHVFNIEVVVVLPLYLASDLLAVDVSADSHVGGVGVSEGGGGDGVVGGLGKSGDGVGVGIGNGGGVTVRGSISQGRASIAVPGMAVEQSGVGLGLGVSAPLAQVVGGGVSVGKGVEPGARSGLVQRVDAGSGLSEVGGGGGVGVASGSGQAVTVAEATVEEGGVGLSGGSGHEGSNGSELKRKREREK